MMNEVQMVDYMQDYCVNCKKSNTGIDCPIKNKENILSMFIQENDALVCLAEAFDECNKTHKFMEKV